MKSSVRLDLEIKSEYLFNSDRKSWAILMRYVEVFVGINAYYLLLKWDLTKFHKNSALKNTVDIVYKFTC